MRHAFTLTLLLTASSVAYADRTVSHRFSSSVPAGRVRMITIDVTAGEINVKNGPADRISITGRARREFDRGRDREENQTIVDDISVEIYTQAGEAVVRPRYGEKAHGWQARKLTNFDVTLEVPPGLSLEFETTFGQINVDGTFGDIDIDLRAGEINLRLPRATVRSLSASCRVGEVRTNLGHEIIVREGVFPGRTRWQNPSGRSVVTAHTTAGEVDVTLVP